MLLRYLVFLTTGLASIWLFQPQTHRFDCFFFPRDFVPAPVETVPHNETVFEYVDDEKLFHHGYEVRRVVDTRTDVSYAIIKRDGKTIAKFDGVDHPMGNQTDFGLFDLLGDKSQQLIVSLSVPRGGNQWVVSLYPTFRELFDVADYSVGRESADWFPIDIDNDGVFEISLPKTSFYGMEGLQSVGETPLPEIVFKYDSKQKKYLPANHLFVDYVMRGWDPEKEKDTYQHHRFNYLLDCVFAGQEKEGWASFDKHYPSADKERMKSRLKAILRNDPVYKYIYKKRKS